MEWIEPSAAILRSWILSPAAIAFFILGSIHYYRANALYANTHSDVKRSIKIVGQLIGMAIVYEIANCFLRLIKFILALNIHDLFVTMASFAVVYVAALVLLRVPITVTLGFKKLRPYKARDGAFEILLDRALVQTTLEAFSQEITAELTQHITAEQLAMLRGELDPPEIADTPEEAAEEARRYWGAVLALMERMRPDVELPPGILDRAAAAGEAAAEAKRATTTSRVDRAVILAKFIDASDEGTIPITSAESRRHPLFMRLGGLHAFLWGTVATVITTSSVAIAIERPDVQLGLAREAGQAMRRWIGTFADSLIGSEIDRMARGIDAAIDTVARELVLTFNLLLKLIAMVFAGASASFDPRIRQVVFAMSIGIFAYYLIAGRQFRYFFILYIWAYAGLSMEMYYRYFIASGEDSLRDRLRSLANALANVPFVGSSSVVASVRDMLGWIGQLSGYALAVPGTLIWGGSALYFTWYILSKEAALVTFERRMRKPGF